MWWQLTSTWRSTPYDPCRCLPYCDVVLIFLRSGRPRYWRVSNLTNWGVIGIEESMLQNMTGVAVQLDYISHDPRSTSYGIYDRVLEATVTENFDLLKQPRDEVRPTDMAGQKRVRRSRRWKKIEEKVRMGRHTWCVGVQLHTILTRNHDRHAEGASYTKHTHLPRPLFLFVHLQLVSACWWSSGMLTRVMTTFEFN